MTETARMDTHLNKKLWFILVCYVVVAILLILLFTWAKYVKNLSGETNIPEVSSFVASIQLGNDSSVVSTALSGLLPGSSSEIDSQIIDFDIRNYEDDEDGTEEIVTDVPLIYNIYVYSTGNLPVDLYLIAYDTDGEILGTYDGVRTLYSGDTLGNGYKYTFYDVDSDGDYYEVPVEFEIGSKVVEVASYGIGYEWQSQVGYVSENMEKEIELLEIRAVVVAGNEYDV